MCVRITNSGMSIQLNQCLFVLQTQVHSNKPMCVCVTGRHVICASFCLSQPDMILTLLSMPAEVRHILISAISHCGISNTAGFEHNDDGQLKTHSKVACLATDLKLKNIILFFKKILFG